MFAPSSQPSNFIPFLYCGAQNFTQVQDTPVLSTVGQSLTSQTSVAILCLMHLRI